MTANVSVIIPTYNRCEYLQLTLDSVLAQTAPPLEVIVVDDGSTDGTGDALQARYGDRLRYYWQENQGESVARNRGIALAQGEYFAFLDSDDLWLPHKLERQAAFLDAHPEVGMVFGPSQVIDAEGKQVAGAVIGRGLTSKDVELAALCRANSVAGPSTVLMRRSALAEVGGFDPRIRYAEDWDLWIRFAIRQAIAYDDEVLTLTRRHRGGQWHFPSAKRIGRQLEDHLLILEKAEAATDGLVLVDWSRARAREYLTAYLDAQACHVSESGVYLAQVLALAPDLLDAYHELGQPLIYRALTMAECDDSSGLHAAKRYVAMVLDDIQQARGAGCLAADLILSELSAGLAHLAFRQGAFRSAVHYVGRAYRYDLHRLGDRGLAGLLLRSVQGSFGLQVSIKRHGSD